MPTPSSLLVIIHGRGLPSDSPESLIDTGLYRLEPPDFLSVIADGDIGGENPHSGDIGSAHLVPE